MLGLFARFWGEEMRKALVAVRIACSLVVVAGLLSLFPQWTEDSVHNDLHFKERLQLMILTKAQEIKTVSSQ